MDGPRIPPCTANIGQACYACFKEELRDGVTLQKCTMCRMVRYCGSGMLTLHFSIVTVYDLIQLENPPACQKVKCLHTLHDSLASRPTNVIITTERLVTTQNLL